MRVSHLGTTRQCPFAMGPMSMNASTVSVSMSLKLRGVNSGGRQIKLATHHGISPAREKRQNSAQLPVAKQSHTLHNLAEDAPERVRGRWDMLYCCMLTKPEKPSRYVFAVVGE